MGCDLIQPEDTADQDRVNEESTQPWYRFFIGQGKVTNTSNQKITQSQPGSTNIWVNNFKEGIGYNLTYNPPLFG